MKTSPNDLQAVANLYKIGYHKQAIERAQVALGNDPDNGKLTELSGMAHYALGHLNASIDALERANTLVPLSAAGQCVLARGYTAAGHRELARDIFRHLLSLEQLPGDLFPVIATGLSSVGDFRAALEACRRAAAIEIDEGQPLYGMAHYMQRLAYPLETIAAVLKRAVDLEPNRFQYRLSLAKILGRLNRYGEAYSVLRAAEIWRLAGVRCENCLLVLATIFEKAGDEQRRDACRRQLSQIEAGI